MDIKKIRENKLIIERVEEALQTAYNSNNEFNAALNTAGTVSFQGLKDPEQEYSFLPSEILYWVERETYFDELDQWDGKREVERHFDAVNYIKTTDQAATFLDLVDAIKLRRIAPFVGAGLSQACDYPGWGDALKKIAAKLEGVDVDDVSPLLETYDYLAAAQVLHNASAAQVNHFIKTEFRQRPSAIRGPALLLPELSKGCIVTTNFDTIIEDIFSQNNQGLDGYMYGMQPGNNFVQRLLRGERCILKLHGDARQENSYVFTENQYTQAYGEPLSFQKQLPRALRQIYISNSLLFLGCSMEHDKTLELFKSVIDEAAFEIPDHFAVLVKPSTVEEKARKEDRLLGLKIRPLWYEPDGNDHSLLEKILRYALAVAKRQIVFQ